MTPEHYTKQLKKAGRWLNRHAKDRVLPVTGMQNGYAAFIAWIYCVRRPGENSVWYVLEVYEQTPLKLKRFCLYWMLLNNISSLFVVISRITVTKFTNSLTGLRLISMPTKGNI